MWFRAGSIHAQRVGSVLILLAAVTLSIVACGPSPSRDGASADAAPVLSVERDGLLFTYHVLTNTEGLFDLQRDPRLLNNLAETRASDAERLRGVLCQELGVGDLAELCDPDDPERARLRSLGYL